MFKDYLRIARLDHWVKNVFIIPGIVAAMVLVSQGKVHGILSNICLGYLATCFIASANYVINEWLDAKFDQFHPTKKHRPVVAGNMKLGFVLLEYFVFAIAGLLLSLLINKLFLLMELWLLVMGILYNVKPFRTKDIIFLDVLSESINNMIRLLLGWFMVTESFLPPASLLIGYWLGGAFLMGIKRLAEYKMIGDPKVAGKYRKSFKYYTEKTLMGSSFFYALCSTFCLGIFLIKYGIEYLFAIPILFALFAYYMMMSYNEDSAVQKPEKLYKEKKLIFIVVLLIIVLVIMTLVEIPILHNFSEPYLIEL